MTNKMGDAFPPIRVQTADRGGRGMHYEELAPEIKQRIIEHFNTEEDGFNSHLGMKLIDVKKGYSRVEVENTDRLCQTAKVMHGGASFGTADAAVALALVGALGQRMLLLTIEMKINYLEPIPKGRVTAEAFLMRLSKRSAYAEVDIWSQGRLAARATTTYMLRPMPEDR